MAERREINPIYYTLILSTLTGALAYVAYQPTLTSNRPKDESVQTTGAWGDQQKLARLWEDPLSVEKTGDSDVLSAEDLKEQIQRKSNGSESNFTNTNTIILGVFIEGFPYAEDREVRLRLRYATQKALMDAGYAPIDRSHLGLVEVDWPKGLVLQTNCYQISHTNWLSSLELPTLQTNKPVEVQLNGDFTNVVGPMWNMSLKGGAKLPSSGAGNTNQQNWGKLQIPFEYCATSETPQKKVLVLWLKEAAFADYPLQRLYLLARLLGVTNSYGFSILGPRSSDTLFRIRNGMASYTSDQAFTNWLCHTRIASPEATAPDALLSTNGGLGRELFSQTNFSQRLGFTNFICTDIFLVSNLVHELTLRGVKIKSDSSNQISDQIVLISESDTLYGRSLPVCFAAAYKAVSTHTNLDGPMLRQYIFRTNWPSQLHSFSYLRGLDGKTGAESADQSSSAQAKDDKQGLDAGVKANRAQGEAQLDYAKRLTREIKDTIGNTHWGLRQPRAIGVVGSDIYDKLILLQALRPEFQDAIFFTTDLDARFLDPEFKKVTRNILVASSYGLLPTTNEIAQTKAVSAAPFRDCYQTAVYLACRNLLGDTASIGQPRLFEVGRTKFVELGVINTNTTEWASTLLPDWLQMPLHIPIWAIKPTCETLLGPGILIAIFIIWFSSTVLFKRWVYTHVTDDSLSLQLSSWNIKQKDLNKREKYELRKIHKDRKFWRFVFIYSLLPIFILIVYWVGSWQAGTADGEPFFFTEGVSVWPAILLRTACVGVGIWLCFDMWHRHKAYRLLLRHKFFKKADKFTSGWFYNRILRNQRHGPSPASTVKVDANEIFHNYVENALLEKRLLRIFLRGGFYLGLLFPFVLYFGRPYSPIRGHERVIFDDFGILILAILTWCFVAFWVIDAVKLSCKMITQFAEDSTTWPPRVLDEIARKRKMDPNHLTGYLDVQFVATHSKEVYRLTFYPMLILLVMIVARMELFDHWSWPPALIFVFSLNTLIMLWSVFGLRQAAARVREAAVKELESHLVEFAAGRHELDSISPPRENYNESLRLTLEEIKNIHTGAYAPWPSDLAVVAALIPTGGAGLIALLQKIMD